MTEIFLNGRFVDEAMVSAMDAGLQHGVGLFETMTGGVGGEKGVRREESRREEWGGGGDSGGTPESRDGAGKKDSGKMPEPREGGRKGETAWVFRLDEHVRRLVESARELGLNGSLRAGGLAEAVVETVRRSGLERARVRLTITGGDVSLLTQAREESRREEGREEVGGDSGRMPEPGGGGGEEGGATVLIVAEPAVVYPEQIFEEGVSVVVAGLRVNPLDPMAGHKTLNYWPRLRELAVAASKGAAEALVFQVTNYLAGGCVSNAFVVKDGELLTPIARGEEGGVSRESGSEVNGREGEVGKKGVLASPVLPGVTRGFVMEMAGRWGVRVVRRMLSIDDVLGADELFMTNASWGVLPVVRVERELVGGGKVGELSRRLRRAWVGELG